MGPIDDTVAYIAFERATGTHFEKFARTLLAEAIGVEFVPLGGTKDGGADGFIEEVNEGSKHGTFCQITVQENYETKIRHTVKRLAEFGRYTKRLYYITSRLIKHVDKEQERLSDDLEVTIIIRDVNWVVDNINYSSKVIFSFVSHIGGFVSELINVGAANTLTLINDNQLRTAFVFLSQEIGNRRGNTELLEAVTDSLILWALRNTDPDKSETLSKAQILEAIEGTVPSAKFVRGILDNRLYALTRKNGVNGREVKHNTKIDAYSLPFGTRTIIQKENADDLLCKQRVMEIFKQRASDYIHGQGASNLKIDFIAEISIMAIERAFYQEGLTFANFLSGGERDYVPPIADFVAEATKVLEVGGKYGHDYYKAALFVVRQSFYDSQPEERVLFGKLLRTYSLLFSIQQEPRVVEWFRSVSKSFVLFVGADIITKALSERYLKHEDQMACNMLRMLKDSGSTLILSEPVLEEVYTHIIAENAEFMNHYMPQESRITLTMVEACSRILIRTYFYARMKPMEGTKSPAGWKDFLRQFVNPERLHWPEGKAELKMFFLNKFSMEFMPSEDIDKGLDKEELKGLTEKLIPIKKKDVLALNDARMVLAIYEKRKILGEIHKPTPFGYRTWWFTQEAIITKYTQDITAKFGARYIMRPEFILNFIAMSPKAEHVRQTYNAVFPSLLGLSIGNRVKDGVLRAMLKRISECDDLEPARLAVETATISNELMTEMTKRYHFNLSNDRNSQSAD